MGVTRASVNRTYLVRKEEAAMRRAEVHDIAPEPIDAHDRVRVPDGRVGEVIGFYRREQESVVVQFASGGSSEFLTSDVEHCS